MRPPPLSKEARFELRILTAMHQCIHSGPLTDRVCRAGVQYRDVAKDGIATWTAGKAPVLPCHGEWTTTLSHGTVIGAPEIDTCPKRTLRTREEAEAHEREVMGRLAATLEARVKIAEVSGARLDGRRWAIDKPTGTVECPKCKGVLRYSVSSYNGHVWGKCETAGCLAWIE